MVDLHSESAKGVRAQGEQGGRGAQERPGAPISHPLNKMIRRDLLYCSTCPLHASIVDGPTRNI